MSKKLWGGCFSKDITGEVLQYTYTTVIDERLLPFDILGSMAHVAMLKECQIVSSETAGKILGALVSLYEQHQRGELKLNPEYEDVHLNIEQLVIQKIGLDHGGQMHSARSRNDQVVLDTRMYLRAELLQIQKTLCAFVASLLDLSEKNADKSALGYTHLQPAQPISLGFWYSCYASMFLRDLERLSQALNVTNLNPLGACALSGTSFPIDRYMTTAMLGFDRPLLHSLDATSSRDFVLQSASAFALLMGNYSRLAEEIVIWSSHEFRLLSVDDSFATGSSIMPQKKNPVVAELVKGKVGRVYGTLMQLLTMVKGVTLGYNCDLQEDKPMMWGAIDAIKDTTTILHHHIENCEYNSARAEELCWQNFSTVTELANFLVSQKGIPFREAHRITGMLTKALINAQTDLRNTEMVCHFFETQGIRVDKQEILEYVSPAHVIRRQRSDGSTGPNKVRQMIDHLRTELITHEQALAKTEEQIKQAEQETLNHARKYADV
ncbi:MULTISPECIES: argininosuccinate lyase [unclassified Brenneria]|uniref:argininosuccinate lyase n=1 Tax=unclassified Brenneria TaxID=2634434 RepID=UPI0015557747|nr:argininosuccinate lyase [Brenneria sp. hezel4-2-4]MEE3652153.1 argininosuccinate lyase [Brenneria sp. HEZEL_4_2_4]NPD02112.1 argininosuccinate lyase [Brenneria sp. hezel4-2-4]